MAFGVIIRSTKAKRKFDVGEIFEILKAEGNLPAEPFMTGSGFTRALFVPGIGKYDICISALGKKISASPIVRSDAVVGNMAKSVLTDGWSDILDSERKQNASLVDAVGDELDRLFKDRA